MHKNRKRISFLLILCILTSLLLAGCSGGRETEDIQAVQTAAVSEETEAFEDGTEWPVFSLSEVPEYSGDPYAVINNNVPYFTYDDIVQESYESYSELDELGRVGVAKACLGQDLMPTESRGDISSVKPTGWMNKQYDCVSGGYLYNRCHLIAFELAGENANKQNLATGTRYLNIEGMLPFENMVADYIRETDNHVMYRITPVFEGDNLLMDGLLMEAYSVEDIGDGITFCVWCYNVQPGIEIDYATGDSREA